MHRSETYELAQCAACGAEIVGGRDRCYPFGMEEALCFACACARGGQYDERGDRWIEPPELSGLNTLG